MTNTELIEAVKQIADEVNQSVTELRKLAGVQPEPPEPVKDRFGEAAEAIDIDPDKTVRSIAVWVACLRSDIAAALARGEAAVTKVERIRNVLTWWQMPITEKIDAITAILKEQP